MRQLDRKKIQKPDFERPHVVILGAGASLAALPNGDRNGRRIPLMKNLVDVVGIGSLLHEAGVYDHHDDFEKLYSSLIVAGTYSALVDRIENAVFEYFAALELPDEPTLYDHLVLSLRKKDVIATFNWDPFLVQAMIRNHEKITTLPTTLFLHGNVAIGHCMLHEPMGVGRRGHKCHVCGRPFETSKLLYPVTEKNYTNAPFIAKSWKLLQRSLEDAFLFTAFGYSAPATDVEAISLFHEAWGDVENRILEQIEIIDTNEEETLYRTWSRFIYSHHYRIMNNFYESNIGLSPRRSCEAMWAQVMDLTFIETNAIPRDAGWDELYRWYRILFEDEDDLLNTEQPFDAG